RAVELFGKGTDQHTDLVDSHRIQPVGRLVEDQDRGSADERSGQSESLLHAERVLSGKPFPVWRQPYKFKSVIYRRLRKPQDTPDDIQVFFSGQVAVESGGFDERSDFP